MIRKTTLILYATAAVIVCFMCSNRTGAASHGWDCTGGETGLGNVTGCSSGGGCHAASATVGIVVSLQLDSAAVPVTGYRGGVTYNVTIRGVNTTSNVLPRFGFQVAAFKGSTAQVTPVNEGTFQQTGLPASVHYQAPVNLTYTVANIVEQSTAIAPDSGTGGTGTVYKEKFTWTAPAAGTGTISFWGALNAVNNNGSNDGGDLWNTQTLVMPEDTVAVVNAITPINNNLNVNIYPNPATDAVQVEMSNMDAGLYNLNVFDVQGNQIAARSLQISSGSSITSLNCADWSAGIYFIKLSKEGLQRVVKVVKK